MTLTGREQELVQALAACIRMVTLPQVHRTWWPATAAGERNCRRRLARLCAAGLLARGRVLAHPILSFEGGPLFRWQPGEPAPDAHRLHRLSYQLQSRWTEALRPTTVYLATRRAAALFGGVADGKVRNSCQATHDLHVSEIYLHLKRTDPVLAACWVGEDILAPSRRGQKLPDAILCDPSGRPLLVMECGGAYPFERVMAFHLDQEARSLAYELY
jgi:hypothetical protein